MSSTTLTIHRGARFEPHAWVVLDDDGKPRRDTAGLEVAAKVRLYPAAQDVLHEFACSAQLVAFPGQYGDTPVAVAQIDEMGPAQTAQLGWGRGVYDVVVNGALVVPTSRVVVRPVVSR